MLITPNINGSNGKSVLLDFEHNSVHKTAPNKSNDYSKYLFHSGALNEPVTFFYQNGYIYSSQYPYQKIDSVKFDITTFEKTNELIYTPIDNKESHFQLNNLVFLFFLFISFLIVGLGIFFIRKTILKKKI
jgi:hypothetical protein